jgi:hypothetical protein
VFKAFSKKIIFPWQIQTKNYFCKKLIPKN